jgi:hypothetical protein
VLLSFSDEARMVTVDPGRVLLSTDPGRATDGGGSITLGPNEGVVLA